MGNTSALSLPIFFSFFLLLFSSSFCLAQELLPSESKTLLRLQRILEHPPALSPFSTVPASNLCYLPPSASLSLSCSNGRVTSLMISGDKSNSSLSPAFSVDSFFTTLARFSSLTSLSLVGLGIWGALPGKVDRFDSLQHLNLSSNHFYGAIPPEISSMTTLKTLALAGNSFNGTVLDLRPLTGLEVLDLSGNLLGPELPSLSDNLVSLFLNNNKFHSNIPMALAAFDKLQKLDLSLNGLAGPVPSFMFSLPSIQYIDLSGNKLTGALPTNLSCGDGLAFVDISSNMLVGQLPSCIASNSSTRVVLDSWNCFSSGDSSYQHGTSYCNEVALAAILPPVGKTSGSKSKLGLILGIVGGIVGGALILGLLLVMIMRRAGGDNEQEEMAHKRIVGKDLMKISTRTPTDARHMSQAVRIGTLGLTPYRIFTMEELEEATNYFDQSNLLGEDPQGQLYRGWIQDGSTVVLKSLKLKQKYSPKNLVQYMDAISKLRHHHLVSILGHCIVASQDGPNSTDTIFLVFEYVSNGTLRSHLTEWRKREMLKWPQRVAAAIGVARGIQFLHTVTVPPIVGNDLRIENILLDETLTAKISKYNLPVLLKNKNNKVSSESPFSTMEDADNGSIQSLEHGEKEDVYQLGLILLEIITGKPAESQNELDALKLQLQKSLNDNPARLRELTDPTIRSTFAHDSLSTVVEVTLNCLSKDRKERPSIDDVLWNLQYSVQVQDGWASSENLSTQS